MKNRLIALSAILFLFVLVATERLSAQHVTSHAYSGWIKLDSYKGSVTKDAFTYMLHIGRKAEYDDWAMKVRANPIITNSEGKEIDPSKISIQLKRVEGGPSLSDLEAIRRPIPLSYADQYIIEEADEDLELDDDYYDRWDFKFDIIIEGGEYLEALKSWDQYTMCLTFSVWDEDKRLISESDACVRMQIYPNDMPPYEPTYGIQIRGDARDGLLEFKTVTDYVNGVEQQYEAGLSITSETSYQLQVRSLTNQFESEFNTLPIETVSLEIQDSDNKGTRGAIVLSADPQTVFRVRKNNKKKETRHFNLRYFTQPGDERLIQATPASYKTTLMYTMTPD